MLKYIRYATILSGVITIVLGLMITMTLPREAELAAGFRTPILAFEFAKSDADVRFLSDADSSGKENRNKMIKGHVWDTYFPVAYGLLLFFMLLGLGLKTKKLIWIGLPFALLAILFDLLENQTLMKIVDSLEESKSASEHFNELYIRTWMKWGAIGISILCVGIGSILQKKRILAAVGLLTFMITLLCWVTGSYPVLVEVMGILVFVFFLTAIVQSVRGKV